MQRTIRILGFFQKSSIRNGETVFHDWVRYAPLHAVQTVVNEERIDRLKPSAEIESNPDRGERAAFMAARWGEIEPAYTAWKEGNELPEIGTPFAAWPGVTPEQAQALKASGIRTVEELSALPDHQMARVHLPNMRDLRIQAKAYLDARGTMNVVDELAAERAKTDAMREQLDEALKMLAELTAPTADAPKRGRKPKAVEANDEQEDEAA